LFVHHYLANNRMQALCFIQPFTSEVFSANADNPARLCNEAVISSFFVVSNRRAKWMYRKLLHWLPVLIAWI
ncbi:hypothetical protein, partial [Winslowiella toletana]|uniref:hypothetical protein n=1 Tax=Winslowiella toletana TaxID=92490 RepID=UPI0019D70481